MNALEIEKNDLNETIQRFYTISNTLNSTQMSQLISDIKRANSELKISPKEYFLYDFKDLPMETRKTFVSTEEYKNTLHNCVKNEIIDVYKNKYKCYKHLQEFYKRDIISVNSFDDYEEFCKFTKKHKKYIVKNESGTLGNHISVVNIGSSDSTRNLFFHALSYGGCVVEEYIEQDETMSKFNDSTVNTIRLTTVFAKNEVRFLFAFLKTGMKNSIVDNGNQGGILALIDVETGAIVSDGYNEEMEQFTEHPDTNLIFKGYQIPKWDELLKFASQIVSHTEGITVIGWDFALTGDGWLVVEANTFPSLFPVQMLMSKTYGHGIAKEYNELLGEYKNNKRVVY